MKATLAAHIMLLCAVACSENEGMNPGECTDGADNDSDGLFDCGDPDCMMSPDCDEDPGVDTGPGGETDTTQDADDDGDGLTNAVEATLGTDPDNADSDGDGYDDGAEVQDGTNPLYEYSHSYTGGYNVGYCEDGVAAATGPTGTGAYGAHTWTTYRPGDVVRNFTMIDQHGEYVDLYSFCGQVVAISVGAFW